MSLPFKAVAVDMDGTFLDDRKEYDRRAFARLLKGLRKRGIHFIAASGRPYPRLIKDFAPFKEQMDFVCLNGSLLVQNERIVAAYSLSREEALTLIKEVARKYDQPPTTVFEPNCTYFLRELPEQERAFLTYFGGKSVLLDNWRSLPRKPILQITFGLDSWKSKSLARDFKQRYQNQVAVFASASKAIDVVQQNINKAKGLQILLRKLGIEGEQLMAFGDGGNDLQMLALAKYSYAMANAIEPVKKRARYLAPSNNESGVLRVLQDYLSKD